MPPAQLPQNAGDSSIETEAYASPTQCSEETSDKAPSSGAENVNGTTPGRRSTAQMPADVPGENCPSQEAPSSTGAVALREVFPQNEVQDQEDQGAVSRSSEPREDSSGHAPIQIRTYQASEFQLGDEFTVMLSEDDCISNVLTRVVPALEGEPEMTAVHLDGSERSTRAGPRRAKRCRGSFTSHRALAKEKHFLAMEHLAKFEDMLI